MRGTLAVAAATAEGPIVELPVAFLCIWVAQRLAPPATSSRRATTPINPKGALQ